MSSYKIDPLHSEIEFKVKHLMISTVNGRFSSFDASMKASQEDFSDMDVEFVADVESISTGVADRDNHLKSVDFFDAKTFPKMKFVSQVVRKCDGFMSMEGLMTIRDCTNPLALKVVYNGSDTDPWGNTKYGFELTGSLSRKEFGLSFNAISGGGNALVDDKINLLISVQMTKIND